MSGKRDRPSNFDDDEKPSQVITKSTNNQSENQTHEKISQRKIYKINMTLNVDKQSGEAKTNQTLLEKQPTGNQTNQTNAKKQESEQNGGKKQQKNQQKSEIINPMNPFSNNAFKFDFSSLGPKFGDSLNGVGIFTNSNISGDKIFSKNNIFTSGSMPSIFNKPATTPTSSIFGNSQSIFNFSSGVPPVKKQSGKAEDDDEGDSGQLQNDQVVAIDRTKSTGNYKYESDTKIIFHNKLLKFKKNEGQVIETAQVVLQSDQNNKNWVVIRLHATKNPICSGLLLKGTSEIKNLGKKDENVVLSIMSMVDKKPERIVLKMQFQLGESGKQFRENVQKIIQ